MLDLKKDFPFFQKYPETIYLDSASTTLKPRAVIESVNEYLTSSVNIQRGDYKLSRMWNKKIEEAVQEIRTFVDAPLDATVIFTSGATDSVNKLMLSLTSITSSKEVIAYAPDDHDAISNAIHQLSPKHHILHLNKNNIGNIDISSLKHVANLKAIFATHIHPIYGSDEDLLNIRSIIPNETLLFVDCSQSIGHLRFSMKDSQVDAVFLSGHKLLADTGIGILLLSPRLAKKIKSSISLYQNGTPNISGILSLGASINYINKIGIDKIHTHLAHLTQYAKNKLGQIKDIRFTKGIAHCHKKDGFGIISFNIMNQNSSDVAFMLDENNILVRAGKQCSGDTLSRDSIRVSMHLYNTKSDIDSLYSQLNNSL